jgi:hypothetical protein
MKDSLDKERLVKSNGKFEEDEEILSMAVYHKNPNFGQVLLFRAWSFGNTAKYFVHLKNKLVVIVPANNILSFKPESIMCVPFENIRIISSEGAALEVKINEDKSFRIYPDTLVNKIRHVDLNNFIKILRSKKKNRNIQVNQIN